ncbi:MAG: hypothetical protein O3B70_08785 [Bacteroidetes bacterium]|nr:hypothetical protein [Bacteroidota bacterium]MDA0904418.1 hypothetical protein [Bacteroidota bacterium]MDA1243278.1 hypothetical protein [Bacteroidota bacterium]
MKSTTFLTVTLSAVAFVAVAMMDWSSMCHPSEEAQATQDQLRIVGESKMASLDLEPVTPLASTTAVDLSGTVVSDPHNGDALGGLAELTWQTLSDVEFKDVYLEELDAYYWMPTFGSQIVAAEGKEFFITGYVIPVDVDEDFYVLSRYPFANCFFCGGAGPESVIDLRFPGKSPRPYQTDERLSFRGVLRLNADDVYQMNYILDGAVEHTP